MPESDRQLEGQERPSYDELADAVLAWRKDFDKSVVAYARSWNIPPAGPDGEPEETLHALSDRLMEADR